ncbi:Mss4-like protein [Aspergillus alliaceus]|uniref:Mss4-like protein n=1 Tax=Petromyces alliaceus TaxID=209559 RepID=A0A5N7C643_PETAA|nr:Mss4-like protein [Aspergillus alliaceus]KAB8230807.1 Mss4-like protein [Aspergillus alliaceus]KAE8389093.1 Mss4-like protein [Aspergillus alliaceus]
MVLTGGCMCGAIRYQANVDKPDVKAVCHCRNCQRWTGGSSTTNVIIPRESFKLIQGEPKTYPYTADSTKTYHTFFCGVCGSGIYGEPDLMPDKLSIKAGSLDDPNLEGEIDYELYTKRRVAYLKPLDGVKQLEGMLMP